MIRVDILPIAQHGDEPAYSATAGEHHSVGHTAGEALDLLTRHLGAAGDDLVVIIQRQRADAYFSETQRQRLETLTERRQRWLEGGDELTADELQELDDLVAAELLASADRAADIATELGR